MRIIASHDRTIGGGIGLADISSEIKLPCSFLAQHRLKVACGVCVGHMRFDSLAGSVTTGAFANWAKTYFGACQRRPTALQKLADSSAARPMADEASPLDVVNAGAGSPFLLIGDHAGRCIPTRLGNLGLREEDLSRHIAWDIGVDGLGRELASRLGATFIAQRYSRLVIDCNRTPARADSILETSDGTTIPGNAGLLAAEARRRREEIFDPYHARIAEELDDRRAQGLTTVVVALHSFTPVMSGAIRPWRHGVLHKHDSAFSAAVLASLVAKIGAAGVGDNQPYQMDETDYSIARHAQSRGLDYLELDVRQDLIGDLEGLTREAKLIAEVLTAAIDQQGVAAST